MDVATHLLIPYAAALAAFGYWRRGRVGDERRAAIAAVVGVAGFAPDLDSLVDPLSESVDALYWLQHRGVSHTLLFAPVFALALVGTLALLARAWPKRFGLFSWRAVFLPWLVVGAWSHLLLDAVTLAGVPLLWPFAFDRAGWMVFHWLVIWLLPVGGVVLLVHALGRLSRRGVVAGGALVLAVLLVVGGIRIATMPDAAPDERVFPRDALDEWMVARELANGSWQVWVVRSGDDDAEPRDTVVYEHRVPPAAQAAVERARDTDAYRGFLMGSYGPRVAYAEPLDGARAAEGTASAWRVTITDVAQRYEATHEPRWTPTMPFEDWGYVAFEVEGDAVRVLHRGW